ncbi:TPA: hypothetical protein ACK210_000638 [Photobacterium damselae subsp. damselae]
MMKTLLAVIVSVVSFSTSASYYEDWATAPMAVETREQPAKDQASDLYFDQFGGNPKDYSFIEADFNGDGVHDVIINDNAVNPNWQFYTTIDGEFQHTGQLTPRELKRMASYEGTTWTIPESKVSSTMPFSFAASVRNDGRIVFAGRYKGMTRDIIMFQNKGRVVSLDDIKVTVNDGQCEGVVLYKPFTLTGGRDFIKPKSTVKMGNWIYATTNNECNVVMFSISDGQQVQSFEQ